MNVKYCKEPTILLYKEGYVKGTPYVTIIELWDLQEVETCLHEEKYDISIPYFFMIKLLSDIEAWNPVASR